MTMERLNDFRFKQIFLLMMFCFPSYVLLGSSNEYFCVHKSMCSSLHVNICVCAWVVEHTDGLPLCQKLHGNGFSSSAMI